MATPANIDKQGVGYGFDMTTGARESNAHPSLGQGCHVSGSSDGGTANGSPGAVLGTGMNPDIYTPGIEGA